jgi:hypothetical protein
MHPRLTPTEFQEDPMAKFTDYIVKDISLAAFGRRA